MNKVTITLGPVFGGTSTSETHMNFSNTHSPSVDDGTEAPFFRDVSCQLDEAARRRSSYGKESGYGGSKESTDTDTAVTATPDEVFGRESYSNGGRWKSRQSLRAMSSLDPNLLVMSETSEESSYSEPSTESGCSDSMPSETHSDSALDLMVTADGGPAHMLKDTPNFPELAPQNVAASSESPTTGSEPSVAPCPSKGSLPSFSQLGVAASIPGRDLCVHENLVESLPSFGQLGVAASIPVRNLHVHDDESMASGDSSDKVCTDTDRNPHSSSGSHTTGTPVGVSQLDPCTDNVLDDNSPVGHGDCFKWQRSKGLELLLGSRSSVPSVPIDAPRRLDAKLNEDLKLCRYRFQEQYVMDEVRRDAPPERIASISQAFMSMECNISILESQCSSRLEALSEFPNSSVTGTSPSQSHPAPLHIDITDQYQEEERSLRSSSHTENQCAVFDKDMLITQLEMAVGCQWGACPDNDCQQAKRLLTYIDRYMDQCWLHGGDDDDIVLRTIAKHADLCDELKCPIPWCTFFLQHDMPFEEQLARLHMSYYTGCISLTSEDSKQNDTTSLIEAPVIASKEHVDWFGIVRLGTYGNTVLAVSAQVGNPAYWVIKQERKNQLQHMEVLKTLRGHPRIVRHQWILEQDSYLYFAAKFEGASMADRMAEAAPRGLPVNRIVRYMEELTSATKFLHTLRVAYLNWTVDNVVLSVDMKHVKLCNFSYAVLIEEVCKNEETLEDLKLLLPARIVPPELYQGEPVCEASDVWGLGCVCYQMATGYMLYHEHRHEHPNTIRETLEEDCPEPDLADVSDVTLRPILRECLQMSPDDRISTAKLHDRLIIDVS